MSKDLQPLVAWIEGVGLDTLPRSCNLFYPCLYCSSVPPKGCFPCSPPLMLE